MKMWIVQRYDGPVVGWFTISPEYANRDQANLFLAALTKTPNALYAVSLGGMP